MIKLNTRYEPKNILKIYKKWESSGYFNPDNLPKKYKKPFCIIMPPPNANGSLHVGHAVFITLQDILIRFYRMNGFKTLWLPGADHAGFETQAVFDKKLSQEGKNRFEILPEELYKQILEFTKINKKIMENQLRKLGASCDWSRNKFTLDKEIIKIVYETFKKLYEDGLVYKDLRVINWCPKHKTALSDLETKYIERIDPLYYIKYGPLTVATVRPETKFGDTALAVHPQDKRYKKFIGQEIKARDVLGIIKIKIIADKAVDPKFGTGVVKITPAHDFQDFEIWKRHKDEIPGPKIVIDEDGRLNNFAGKFAGLKTIEARPIIVEKMKKMGILEKIDENYKHKIVVCYKCQNILEPIPKEQWFIKMTSKPKSGGKSLKDLGIEAVKSKKINFYPPHTKKIYFHWLSNIQDWNISRQIIWGIKMPVWYCQNPNCKYINVEAKKPNKCRGCKNKKLVQEKDVFD
ncbi:MAG: class I tRNA ligase family protein, partial [Patescibacteria group bacterium]|nr:class I tRNA ligase family protein [Patescibacteria group bacterium]